MESYNDLTCPFINLKWRWKCTWDTFKKCHCLSPWFELLPDLSAGCHFCLLLFHFFPYCNPGKSDRVVLCVHMWAGLWVIPSFLLFLALFSGGLIKWAITFIKKAKKQNPCVKKLALTHKGMVLAIAQQANLMSSFCHQMKCYDRYIFWIGKLNRQRQRNA